MSSFQTIFAQLKLKIVNCWTMYETLSHFIEDLHLKKHGTYYLENSYRCGGHDKA